MMKTFYSLDSKNTAGVCLLNAGRDAGGLEAALHKCLEKKGILNSKTLASASWPCICCHWQFADPFAS